MTGVDYGRIVDIIKEEGDSALVNFILNVPDHILGNLFPDAIEDECQDCLGIYYQEELDRDGVCQDCAALREEEQELEDEE